MVTISALVTVTDSATGKTVPVSGAFITFTVRRPTPPGGSTTLTAPIGADGKAAVHYRVKQKDRTGQYQVQAGASFLGFTRSTSTTFMVQ